MGIDPFILTGSEALRRYSATHIELGNPQKQGPEEVVLWDGTQKPRWCFLQLHPIFMIFNKEGTVKCDCELSKVYFASAQKVEQFCQLYIKIHLPQSLETHQKGSNQSISRLLVEFCDVRDIELPDTVKEMHEHMLGFDFKTQSSTPLQHQSVNSMPETSKSSRLFLTRTQNPMSSSNPIESSEQRNLNLSQAERAISEFEQFLSDPEDEEIACELAEAMICALEKVADYPDDQVSKMKERKQALLKVAFSPDIPQQVQQEFEKELAEIHGRINWLPSHVNSLNEYFKIREEAQQIHEMIKWLVLKYKERVEQECKISLYPERLEFKPFLEFMPKIDTSLTEKLEKATGPLSKKQEQLEKHALQYIRTNYKPVEKGAGGNCFFYAIIGSQKDLNAKQLADFLNGPENLWHAILRTKITQHMKDNRHAYEGLIEERLTHEDRSFKNRVERTPGTDNFEKYLNYMEKLGTWGGKPEAQAASNLFGTPLVIVRTLNHKMDGIETFSPKIDRNTAPIVILNREAVHFQALLLRPHSNSEDSSSNLNSNFNKSGPEPEAAPLKAPKQPDEFSITSPIETSFMPSDKKKEDPSALMPYSPFPSAPCNVQLTASTKPYSRPLDLLEKEIIDCWSKYFLTRDFCDKIHNLSDLANHLAVFLNEKEKKISEDEVYDEIKKWNNAQNSKNKLSLDEYCIGLGYAFFEHFNEISKTATTRSYYMSLDPLAKEILDCWSRHLFTKKFFTFIHNLPSLATYLAASFKGKEKISGHEVHYAVIKWNDAQNFKDRIPDGDYDCLDLLGVVFFAHFKEVSKTAITKSSSKPLENDEELDLPKYNRLAQEILDCWSKNETTKDLYKYTSIFKLSSLAKDLAATLYELKIEMTLDYAICAIGIWNNEMNGKLISYDWRERLGIVFFNNFKEYQRQELEKIRCLSKRVKKATTSFMPPFERDKELSLNKCLPPQNDRLAKEIFVCWSKHDHTKDFYDSIYNLSFLAIHLADFLKGKKGEISKDEALEAIKKWNDAQDFMDRITRDEYFALGIVFFENFKKFSRDPLEKDILDCWSKDERTKGLDARIHTLSSLAKTLADTLHELEIEMTLDYVEFVIFFWNIEKDFIIPSEWHKPLTIVFFNNFKEYQKLELEKIRCKA